MSMKKYKFETEAGNSGIVWMDIEPDELPDDLYLVLMGLIDDGEDDLIIECESIVLSEKPAGMVLPRDEG